MLRIKGSTGSAMPKLGGPFSPRGGMDGYRNDERASLYLEGPGVIRFSRFGTEGGC